MKQPLIHCFTIFELSAITIISMTFKPKIGSMNLGGVAQQIQMLIRLLNRSLLEYRAPCTSGNFP